MASEVVGRANWKDPELLKLFLDLCLEETTIMGKRGSSLKKESWEKISKIIAERKCLQFTQRQLKNEWDYLKQKYTIWSNLVNSTGHGYNPVTRTMDWPAEKWDNYIKANPLAKQYRHVGLLYIDEMRSLFDGVTATGKGGWGPSRDGLPPDGLGSSTTSQAMMGNPNINFCNLEAESPPTPSSPEDIQVTNVKRSKKNKAGDIDGHISAVLKSLENSDGPSLEECNRILDEMKTLPMDDPLYIVACTIFWESKAH